MIRSLPIYLIFFLLLLTCQLQSSSALKCVINPCMNGATCNQESLGQVTCICLPNFQGINCEIPVQSLPRLVSGDPCSGITCSGHGSCHSFNQNEYLCLCNSNLKFIKTLLFFLLISRLFHVI